MMINYKNLFYAVLVGVCLANSQTHKFTSPSNNAILSSGSFQVVVQDTGKTVKPLDSIQLEVDTKRVGAVTSAPYQFNLSGLAVGGHLLTAHLFFPGGTRDSLKLHVSVDGQLDAYTEILGEAYTQQSGINTLRKGNDLYIGWIDKGDYIGFQKMNFTSAAGNITLYSGSHKPNQIEVRLDSATGKLAGVCNTIPGGSWEIWLPTVCGVNVNPGIHDVYLVFASNWTDGLLYFDRFKFGTEATNNVPAVTFTLPNPNSTQSSEGFNVQVSAQDFEGPISFIELFANGTLVAKTNSGTLQTRLTGLLAGNYVLMAKAWDATGKFGVQTRNIVVSGNTIGKPYIAINSAGPDFIGENGIAYKADTAKGESNTNNLGLDILGSPEQSLYKTFRSGAEINYNLTVPNSRQIVRLNFVETGSVVPGTNLFHVLAEGDTLAKGLDLAQTAGILIAYNLLDTIDVRDGELNIQLIQVKGGAKISSLLAIQDSVFAEQPPLAPTLVSPQVGSNVFTNLVTFKWNKVQGATTYEFELYTNAELTQLWQSRIGITADSITLSVSPNGGLHYWKVKAKGTGGKSSSNVWSFNVQNLTSTQRPSLMGLKSLPILVRGNQFSFQLSQPADLSVNLYSISGIKSVVVPQKRYPIGTYTFSLPSIQGSHLGYYQIRMNDQIFTQSVVNLP